MRARDTHISIDRRGEREREREWTLLRAWARAWIKWQLYDVGSVSVWICVVAQSIDWIPYNGLHWMFHWNSSFDRCQLKTQRYNPSSNTKKYIFKKILESHTQKHCEKDNQSHIAQAEYVHDLIKFLLKIEIDFNFSVQ